MQIKIIEGTDYKFVEKESSDFYSVKLLSGKWQGLIYTYGQISIKESPQTDCATLSFDYKIEEFPSATTNSSEFEKDEEFKNYLGEVLTNIIEESEFKIGENNGTEPASDHTQELNSERDLLP